MKNILLRIFLFLILGLPSRLDAQYLSSKGHAEHFLAGAIIGGATTCWTYQRTGKKSTSIAVGILTSATVGGLKEIIDNALVNKEGNVGDFAFTALGGLAGVSIAIPLARRKNRRRINERNKFDNSMSRKLPSACVVVIQKPVSRFAEHAVMGKTAVLSSSIKYPEYH